MAPWQIFMVLQLTGLKNSGKNKQKSVIMIYAFLTLFCMKKNCVQSILNASVFFKNNKYAALVYRRHLMADLRAPLSEIRQFAKTNLRLSIKKCVIFL